MNIPEQLFSDCDYLNDERDSEFAPYNGECIYCYRYEDCYRYYISKNSFNKNNNDLSE